MEHLMHYLALLMANPYNKKAKKAKPSANHKDNIALIAATILLSFLLGVAAEAKDLSFESAKISDNTYRIKVMGVYGEDAPTTYKLFYKKAAELALKNNSNCFEISSDKSGTYSIGNFGMSIIEAAPINTYEGTVTLGSQISKDCKDAKTIAQQ